MKVVLVGQKGIPCTQGGIERYAEELSLRLIQRGHDVVVYTRPYYTPRNMTDYRGVRLVSLWSLRLKNFDAITHSFLATLHAVFIERADVIHYMNIGPALVSWLPRLLRPHARVVGTFQSPDWEHEKWSTFARMMLRLGAWAVCHFPHRSVAVSRDIARYAQEKYSKNLPIVSNGVTVRPQLSEVVIERVLDTYGLRRDQFFLVASRLIRHKGVHYLINAFNRLCAEYPPSTGYKLVICGDGFHTDDYVDHLRGLAKDNEDIIFTGWQTGETYQAFFEAAHAFVQPSEAEGLSLTLLEALGHGKTVIVSDISPNLEAIATDQNEQVALVFKSRDVESLYLQLKRTFEEDCTRYGVRAREHVAKRYSWETISRDFERIYCS